MTFRHFFETIPINMDSPTTSSSVVPRQYWLPFILMVSCFALWGLVNAMAEALVPAFKSVFPELSNMGKAMSLAAHYGAYAVLAIPAAIIVKRYSYKAGVLLGLGVFAIGVLGYIPATISHSYDICLASIFIYASGCSILETSCNPYVLSMGSQETSARRLNFAQAFNPLGCLIGLFIGKFVIFANFVEPTKEVPLTDVQQSSNMQWLATPYVILALVAITLWVIIFCRKMPEGSGADKSDAHDPEQNFSATLKRLMRIPRYYWGVITQFFYVGLQTMAWAYIVDYAAETVQIDKASGMSYYIYAMVCFIVMRIICTALMKKFNPANMMSLLAVIGILLCLGIIYLPGWGGVVCAVAISACLSLMFPTIYGIALRDLGPDAKLGAAGLIMSILGGAAIPPLFAANLDHNFLSWTTMGLFPEAEAIIRSSYYILVGCLLVVLVYGIRFRNAHLSAVTEEENPYIVETVGESHSDKN